MLGIKQIFRKEEPTGTCPICDVAYKRVKRDLRADCFDASYVITAWTLLCPECGYTLILPGMAKIRPASSSAQEERAEGGEIPVAVSKMDEADKPRDVGTATESTEKHTPETAETAEPEESAVPATQEQSQTPPAPEPPAEPKEGPVRMPAEKPEEKPATPPVKTEKKVPVAAKPTDTGAGTGNAPKPAERQDTAGNKASAETEQKRSDKAEQKAAANAKPAQLGTQKVSGTPKDAPQEKKPAAGSTPSPDEKRGGDVGTKQTKPEAKPTTPKADNKDSRQGKPKAEKPAPDRRAPAPQPKAQPRPQPRPSPKMGMMGQGMHPAPPFGPGRTNGGFSTGGSFPTSALSNLDSLKAFVQEQEAEKANVDKTNSGTRTPNQVQSRQPAQGPGNTKAADTAAKLQEPARPEKKDTGTAVAKKEKPAVKTDAAPSKAAETDIKTLSAEANDRKPADKKSDAPAGQADTKNSEKSLSAKNDGDAKVQNQESAKAEDKKMAAKPAEEPTNQQDQGRKEAKDSPKTAEAEKLGQQEAAKNAATSEASKPAELQEPPKEETSADGETQAKGAKAQAMAAAQKLQEKLPPDLAEKIPVISTIAKQQKHALFISEEKRYLETHVPHTQFIINDLVYDTETSEMFLRVDGQYGLDRPCVHYNYRTRNGNFFRCTVKYKHEDSIRALDEFEAKRMLEKYPDLYRKFFPDSVSDA